MRKILILLSFCLIQNSYGKLKKIDCSDTNLGNAYNTSSPQLALTDLQYQSHLCLTNMTSKKACWYGDSNSTTSAPSSSDGKEHCVGAMSFMCWDNVPIQSVLYARVDDASSCTSGIIYLDTWGSVK